MKLYILAFDHRSSLKRMFPDADWKDYKKIIYEGFLAAKITDGAILVDEELGRDVLIDAQKNNVPTFLSLEKSGQENLELIYDDLAEKTEEYGVHGVKILLKYKDKLSSSDIEILKKVSDFAQVYNISFLLEPLAEEGQRVQAVKEILANDIKPSIFKLEGSSQETMQQLSAELESSKIVVLGRGAEEEQVREWLATAAPFPNVIGFAVGRTIFCPSLEKYYREEISREEAVSKIKESFSNLVVFFEEKK